MRHIALLFALFSLVMLTSACGDYANTVSGDVGVPSSNGPNPQNLPNANHVPKPTTPDGYVVSPSPVTIEEVLANPDGEIDGNQYVELFNASQYETDIGGWTLSDGMSTHTFPYGFRVAPGERVLVHVGVPGTSTELDQYAPGFAALDPAQGSLALLRGGIDLVDFVQWGAAGNHFEQAADQAGEWPIGDFVVPGSEGQSLNYSGTANDSSAWFADVVTPGG